MHMFFYAFANTISVATGSSWAFLSRSWRGPVKADSPTWWGAGDAHARWTQGTHTSSTGGEEQRDNVDHVVRRQGPMCPASRFFEREMP